MRGRKQTPYARLVFLVRSTAAALLVALCLPVVVLAAQSNSANYQVNEVFFGSGGTLNSCSTTYCSKQSAGEVTVGNTKSTSYQAQGGFNTDRQPFIEFSVTNTSQDVGTLSTTSTKTAQATFTIKTYLAHGYTVINASDPPSNNGYTMAAPTVPTASTTGTEQFGINLVANTTPAVGANLQYTPSSTFSSGLVSSQYNDPNFFKYAKGDTIAYSDASSSYTTYTISYIFNVSSVTPGGTYVMNHVLVATSTY